MGRKIKCKQEDLRIEASLGRKMCPAGLKHHRTVSGAGGLLVMKSVKKEMWPIVS
jgi:hypothetical protein